MGVVCSGCTFLRFAYNKSSNGHCFQIYHTVFSRCLYNFYLQMKGHSTQMENSDLLNLTVVHQLGDHIKRGVPPYQAIPHYRVTLPLVNLLCLMGHHLQHQRKYFIGEDVQHYQVNLLYQKTHPLPYPLCRERRPRPHQTCPAPFIVSYLP